MPPLERTGHTSEGHHWYDRQGRPVYEVPSADGKRFVEPDVRHARKLGLVPGVSGIINCAAKPGLTTWQINQGIMSSLTLPRRPHEPDIEFIRRIVEDSQQQAQKAAERGTAIHAAIESYYEERPYSGEFRPHVEAVAQAVEARFGISRAGWHAERTFAHNLGFGGKTDLHSPLISPKILLDFKSKEFKEAPAKDNKVKLAWDENCMQLAAYRHGLGAPECVCANVYVSRDVPGLVHVHEWPEEDLERGWTMFLALLHYWKAARKYDSGWTA
jgi:hypothetical protein